MVKPKAWEIENEVGFFKIDLEKISFASKNGHTLRFEDFYYHPNDNQTNNEYFKISSKFIIKDIAIYYDGHKIILCFKNDRDIVKILTTRGSHCNDIPIKDIKAVDFHCICGHETLHGKTLNIIKNFDVLNYEKILHFKRNKNDERI